MSGQSVSVRIAAGVGQLPAAEWDALAGGNPFLSHAFLTALEDSASVGPGTGWSPAPMVIEGEGERLEAALPAYLKDHSQGEYVFDHSWADAWHRAGGSYYPKLQIAVPFTPATGPRLLTDDPLKAALLLRGAEHVCADNGLSSAHATFIEPAQLPWFEAAGWLLRSDIQFHWTNRGYASFDDFLAQLSSRKRKDLRKERAAAQQGVTIRQLRGAEIRGEHWDAFWQFYQDTGARKWGRPYLTRSAFDLLGQRMGDRILLVMAFAEGRAIAGALNFIGPDALYGRYWGALERVDCLHFEACYYQPIDWCIQHGVARFEGGAQGEHKMARALMPVATASSHWLAHPAFADAVERFLARESEGIEGYLAHLDERSPFRH